MALIWRVAKIPIFDDNFIFVIHNTKDAILVDPGEASAAIQFLEKSQMNCVMILITHHHIDHIGGVVELKNKYLCPVYGPLKNKSQLKEFTTDWLEEGAQISYKDLQFQIFEMPGHTLGHIAYWNASNLWLFSGDVLFSLGCGRLFEGTFVQMFQTLQRIKALPEATTIFCTHDYYPNNRRFCVQQNISMEGYQPLHPLTLAQEKKFNPFLTAKNREQFQNLREKRNQL